MIGIVDTPKDILFPFFVFGVAPWAIGRVIRTQTALARELAEQEARVRHLRELEESSAVASERARIARDLHDVLAHSLSVMVVQASGARRALATDPAAAIDAAKLIERSGRDALVELRRLFGTVRRGEVEALDGSPGPRPGRGARRPLAPGRAAGNASGGGRAGRARRGRGHGRLQAGAGGAHQRAQARRLVDHRGHPEPSPRRRDDRGGRRGRRPSARQRRRRSAAVTGWSGCASE